MNEPAFWVQQGLKILFNGRYNRPAITQTLTYRVEQPVPVLNPSQWVFASFVITRDESKRTLEKLSCHMCTEWESRG